MMGQDLRVRRTKEQITKALVELINERGFRKVTVTAIIDRAGINRSTFYAHYLDKYDLLDQIQVDVLERVRQVIGGYIPPEAVPAEELEQIRDPQTELFTVLARYLYRERPLVLALSQTGDFYGELKAVVTADVRARREELHVHFSGLIPADYAEELLVNSMLDLIYFWVRKEKPEPPREFVEIIKHARLAVAYHLLESGK